MLWLPASSDDNSKQTDHRFASSHKKDRHGLLILLTEHPGPAEPERKKRFRVEQWAASEKQTKNPNMAVFLGRRFRQ